MASTESAIVLVRTNEYNSLNVWLSSCVVSCNVMWCRWVSWSRSQLQATAWRILMHTSWCAVRCHAVLLTRISLHTRTLRYTTAHNSNSQLVFSSAPSFGLCRRHSYSRKAHVSEELLEEQLRVADGQQSRAEHNIAKDDSMPEVSIAQQAEARPLLGSALPLPHASHCFGSIRCLSFRYCFSCATQHLFLLFLCIYS